MQQQSYIEINQLDDEQNDKFYEQFLKQYLEEVYQDLLYREAESGSEFMTFKVFSEVSRIRANSLVLQASWGPI
jgi:hypothetical protein